MIITCPKCKARYQLKDPSKAGRIRCKKCQTVIEVKASGIAEDESRAEMKTMPSAAAPPESRAEMKTMPSAAPAEAASRAETKTVVSQPAPSSTVVNEEGEEADPLVGKTLGGYEVIRKLGEGGMGAVYEARQIALDRSVALKVLSPHLAANKEFIRRFTREALSVARLNHTNIVQIYDVGNHEGTYYFSMEFVRGATLDTMVEESGKMDPDAAVGFIVQAARGLEYAHKKKIIHRDIKPENIMVNEEGVAKVADLGLAKQTDEEVSVTMSGTAMGTPVYMAPEQGTDAKHVDERADIYSLGCTLYHLITGRVPFTGASAYEIITKHKTEPLVAPRTVDPNIPEEISKIVERMMAKEKEDRHGSMKEVIGALEEYMGVSFAKTGFQPSEEQVATLKGCGEKVAAIAGESKGRVTALGLCGAAVVVALLLGWWKPLSAVFWLVEYAVLAPVLCFFVIGSRRKTYLYRRVRKYIFGNKVSDWLVTLVVLAVAAALVVLLNQIVVTVVAVGLAAGTAFAFHLVVTKPRLARLDGALEEVKRFTRELRRKGIPEEEIHLFVCRHGGLYGELMCEEAFGRDAVVGARAKRSEEEVEGGTLGARLRERVIGWIDAAEEKRELERRAGQEAAKALAEADIAEGETVVMGAGGGEGEVVEAEVLEDDVDAIVEGRKARVNPAVAIPRFILGGKGRVTAGAIMILVAAGAWKFGGAGGALTSPAYVLFSLALLVSGLVRSKAGLACLVISMLISGPAGIYAGKSEAGWNKPLIGTAAGDVPLDLTPVVLGGLVFLIIGVVAAMVMKPRKTEDSVSNGGHGAGDGHGS